jgi:peptide/nickel transport system substrate-binding protein
MKKILVVSLFIIMLLGIAAIGASKIESAEPQKGGSLVIWTWPEPLNLNPMYHKSDISMNRVVSNIFEPLLEWDLENRKSIPCLATEWQQKDPKTWIFKLRKGVQFQKGFGEMTAEDVAFTANYIIQKNTPTKFLFDYVKEAVVIDKYTVQYNLERPHAPFLLSAASVVGGMIVCKKAFEKKGPEVFNRDPVGTGPYEFGEWIAGDRIVLRKFEGYWDKGKPHIEKLVFKVVPESYTAETMFRAGEIDFLPQPEFKDIEKLKKLAQVEVQSIGAANWDYITFDCKKTPFNKKEIRQAISYAIDRQAIVDSVYYGWAVPTDNPLPSGFLGAGPDLQRYPKRADLTKAKELLTKAGYPNGFTTTVITSSKENLRKSTQIAAEQLKKVGIICKIEQLDMATYVKRTSRASDFEMELEDIGIMSPDPDSCFWWFHHTGTTRMHGHENPVTDKLLEEGRAEQDPAKRAKIYHDVNKQILEESPYVYIAHVAKVNLFNKALKGFKINQLETDLKFKEAWLDR